jgi:DNA processing protein
MDYPITRYPDCAEFPLLREIPEPPKVLYTRGNLPPPDMKCLAVVGSRNYSNYGKQVISHLIEGLRGYPVSIVSGLARGVDGLAHEAALQSNLHTVAIPGSGLNDNVLYPRQHLSLAHRILESGGGLLSEYEPDFKATKWSFPRRNRIMAGFVHATLLIEASEKSGTLITARLTAEYNRELLVVPGSIFSENSTGVHQFLKLGATPVTDAKDILMALRIDIDEGKTTSAMSAPRSPLETRLIELLTEPLDRDHLIRALDVPVQEANVLLMKMELTGLIKEDNGMFYKG